MWKFALIIFAAIALKIYIEKIIKDRKEKKKYAKWEKHYIESQDKASDPKDYTKCYQKKFLLTKNEYHAYKSLKDILDKYEMIVCPKVRLLDIIEPINGDNYKGALGKIQSKHVDFVVCDKDLYIKGIIELDDSSHNAADRQERDQFVNAALGNVGYKVLHVKAITEETVKELLPKDNE